MRRFLLIVLLSVGGIPALAQYNPANYTELLESEVCSAFREHISFLSSAALEGRKAGSDGEKEAAAYVRETLVSFGLDVFSPDEGDVFGMKLERGDTLVSRNVMAFIPGYDKALRDHYIVIGARLDNIGTSSYIENGEEKQKIFYGANGNGSGLAVLLQLAKMLSTNRVLLKRSVIIAAFGASLEQGAGAWYFLNRSFMDAGNIDAMINLEMLGTPSNGFYAYTSSNQDLNDIVNGLSYTLQPVQPDIVAQEPVNSCHRQFYEKEIPSIMFTTGMYPEYNTEKDTASVIEYQDMERVLEYLYNFTLKLVNGGKPAFRRGPAPKIGQKHSDTVPYHDCTQKPVFLGSSDPSVFMKKWVYVYLKYPQEAIRQGIQGKVQVDFIIDKKGKVRDVTVVKGVDPLLDEEAVRVISASPDWKAGRLLGEKVNTEMSLYVEFRLEKRKKR